MDFKDFHDGLLSSSLLLIAFSVSLIYSSIFLKPYLALEPYLRDYIVPLSIISLIFSIIYVFIALKTKKIFKLEIKNIFQFGKNIAILNICFTPHLFFLIPIFYLEIHGLLLFLVLLNLILELTLIGIVYREVYDLIIKDENERIFEIEQNQQYYYREG